MIMIMIMIIMMMMMISQEYEMAPMLYKGHKFDVRAWGVVTSLDPLRLYLLDHFAPKVSQLPFSTRPEDTKDQCVHVQVISVNPIIY